MIEKSSLVIKHTMSCLDDQRIELAVDRERRVVTLWMDVFDSSLVSAVVLTHLPEIGVIAYRNDSKKVTEALLTPASPFRLGIVIAGNRYRSQVVRLFSSADVSITLTPDANDN